MTQTHRGEGGIGGLSESYCPKCDVVKSIGSAITGGWNALTENPQARQKRVWEQQMTDKHGKSGNYDGKWRFGEHNTMPGAPGAYTSEQQEAKRQYNQQVRLPQATPPVGEQPLIQASNDRAFRTGWAVVKGETPLGSGKGNCKTCGKPMKIHPNDRGRMMENYCSEQCVPSAPKFKTGHGVL